MRITIREQISPDEVTVPGGDALGYRIRFGCALGEGPAVLVPARRRFGWKVGSELQVETSQASIADIKIWKNRGTMVPMLTPLEADGDFQVRGLVAALKDSLVYVDAGGIEFVLPAGGELTGLDARPGDNIMFTLQGLGLWEKEA
jgi:hypothetical protein